MQRLFDSARNLMGTRRERQRLVITDNFDLKRQIMLYFTNSSFRRNNPIETWDVSRVTDMSYAFRMSDYSKYQFNKSLNDWDVSNVTDMSNMFVGCKTFNQPLDRWNVSNVTDMSSMFADCPKFNQSLDNWDVSNVITMASMFLSASTFNQALNNWDVSNVQKMDRMFMGASHFNQPLDRWDVRNCTDFRNMFTKSNPFDNNAFRQDLSNWRIQQDAYIDSMFNPDFPNEFKPQLIDRPRPNPVQGIAFQVHNKFDNLDLTALTNLINSGSNLDEYTGNNLNQEWLTELRTMVQNSGNTELSDKLSRISGKIGAIDFAEAIDNLNSKNFFYTILNFVKRQPKEYQDNYVNFLIEDSCSAYSTGDTTSCVKGIKERMVLALGQAGYNLDNELYKQISATLFQVKDSQIFHFISACLETNKSSFVGKPMDEKKQLLLNCVNNKLRGSGEMGVNSRIMELIGQSEDMLDDDALTGGRRKRRTRKKIKQRTNKRKTTNKYKINKKTKRRK